MIHTNERYTRYDKKTVYMTLTGCEFQLFTTVTELVTTISMGFHTDHICCTWLQISSIYIIDIQSIIVYCLDKPILFLWMKINK